MVTMAEVFVEVPAPPVVPHPYGLFSVAPPRDAAEAWQFGITFPNEACQLTLESTKDACLSGETVAPKVFGACCPDMIQSKPNTLWHGCKVTMRERATGD